MLSSPPPSPLVIPSSPYFSSHFSPPPPWIAIPSSFLPSSPDFFHHSPPPLDLPSHLFLSLPPPPAVSPSLPPFHPSPWILHPASLPSLLPWILIASPLPPHPPSNPCRPLPLTLPPPPTQPPPPPLTALLTRPPPSLAALLPFPLLPLTSLLLPPTRPPPSSPNRLPPSASQRLLHNRGRKSDATSAGSGAWLSGEAAFPYPNSPSPSLFPFPFPSYRPRLFFPSPPSRFPSYPHSIALRLSFPPRLRPFPLFFPLPTSLLSVSSFLSPAPPFPVTLLPFPPFPLPSSLPPFEVWPSTRDPPSPFPSTIPPSPSSPIPSPPHPPTSTAIINCEKKKKNKKTEKNPNVSLCLALWDGVLSLLFAGCCLVLLSPVPRCAYHLFVARAFHLFIAYTCHFPYPSLYPSLPLPLLLYPSSPYQSLPFLSSQSFTLTPVFTFLSHYPYPQSLPFSSIALTQSSLHCLTQFFFSSIALTPVLLAFSLLPLPLPQSLAFSSITLTPVFSLLFHCPYPSL
ncbi:hypothetical protein C7M84_012100 [Penaeus vannamei]|uniref:Uncharacterized protein n=1 Tax=Penaeus vannamei TaxID=6689 RepID=A0A423SZQ3_PENVA|nr:hypothetical protein C7M84_012100 [Penaeus vannamei]